MKNCVHLLQYLAELLLKSEMCIRFYTENGNIHFMSNNIRPSIVRFIEIKCKYHDGIRHANHDNLITRMRFAY